MSNCKQKKVIKLQLLTLGETSNCRQLYCAVCDKYTVYTLKPMHYAMEAHKRASFPGDLEKFLVKVTICGKEIFVVIFCFIFNQKVYIV